MAGRCGESFAGKVTPDGRSRNLSCGLFYKAPHTEYRSKSEEHRGTRLRNSLYDIAAYVGIGLVNVIPASRWRAANAAEKLKPIFRAGAGIIGFSWHPICVGPRLTTYPTPASRRICNAGRLNASDYRPRTVKCRKKLRVVYEAINKTVLGC